MRSCGRARKWDGTGKLLGMREGDKEVASIIGMLLREDSRGNSGVLVNARKHRVEEKTTFHQIMWWSPDVLRDPLAIVQSYPYLGSSITPTI